MSKSTNRRKSIAIALAVLGVAGLSLASAAQLNLTGTGSVQSGAINVTADCQSTTIAVAFATPSLSTTTPKVYGSQSLTLSSIDAGCVGKKFKVALLDATGTPVAGDTEGSIVAAGPLTLAIPTGKDVLGTRVALTIYS